MTCTCSTKAVTSASTIIWVATSAEHEGHQGGWFSVWAPDAETVSVIGSFNGWNASSHRLATRGQSGLWEAFIPDVKKGDTYKFHIASRLHGYEVDKADPFAFHAETPPHTGSKVWDLDYAWDDSKWMSGRGERNSIQAPMSIYEVHLGSWRRVPEEGNRSLSYREIAEPLADYVIEMGFTHVEFLPITEHPFFGSWGYQTTGYFAPTSRYGTPQDLMYLIDHLHQRGIGVILDWVPSHFPTDEWALGFFDGTHLYEHSDPRKGLHKDWDSYIFNYGRHEVRSFLLSSAHVLAGALSHGRASCRCCRLDALPGLLPQRKANGFLTLSAGRENIEAVEFLRRFNAEVYSAHPDVQTIAEESTSWPGVSRPTYLGGLGFGLKWDMGWMNDTLKYISLDPVHRKYHHNQLTFRMIYAFHENFVLPLSHDESSTEKDPCSAQMPGDLWQKFANVRLLFAYQFAQPGKKLLFMGGEFGQWSEWAHDGSLDWHLLGTANRTIRCNAGSRT